MSSHQRILQPEDLRWLVCPVCHQALALDSDADSDSDSDAVRCTGCARRYPTVDGIPVLLPGRAS